MLACASELREKDVINTCGGKRLGYVCDYQLDTDSGKICALYVTEQFFGILSNKGSIRIPWDKIVCIGEDTILVELNNTEYCEIPECKTEKRKKRGWLL